MKGFLKTIMCLPIVTLAIFTNSCGGDDVKSLSETYTVYDKGDCYYFGNVLLVNTPVFIIDMYGAVDENIGIQIQGFTSSATFAGLNITGSYPVATTGAVLTCAPGAINNSKPSGTFVYNYNTGSFTLVTGGSFDVTVSEGKYIVTTNFTGKDSNTGAAVNNIKYSFTGALTFLDQSSGSSSGALTFSEIVKSNYNATGTPGNMTTPAGPSSWTGQVTPSSGQDLFYEITGWGGKTSLKVWCDFVDGKIIMDNYSKVAEDGIYDGYFYPVAMDNNAKTFYMIDDDYAAAYDRANKRLDFSGTYNGLPVYVGVLAKNSNTGEFAGLFTDMYANAKLTLSQASQSSAMQPGAFSYSSSISSEELKTYRIMKKTGMKKPDRKITIIKETAK